MEAIEKRCLELFDRDYKYSIISNYSGEVCGHYPRQIVFLEYESTEVDRDRDRYVPGQRVVSVSEAEGGSDSCVAWLYTAAETGNMQWFNRSSRRTADCWSGDSASASTLLMCSRNPFRRNISYSSRRTSVLLKLQAALKWSCVNQKARSKRSVAWDDFWYVREDMQGTETPVKMWHSFGKLKIYRFTSCWENSYSLSLINLVNDSQVRPKVYVS